MAEGSGDLVLVFVFLIATLVAAAAGFFVGSVLGRTEGANLAGALALARRHVETSAQRLRSLSSRLVGLDRSARHAGDALVLATKLSTSANDLGTIERRAVARNREGSE